MRRLLTKLKFAAIVATACLALHAQPKKWNLALAANSSDNAVIAAGWPVVLRASVSWTTPGPGFDTFDPAQAIWEVFSSSGARQNWQITALNGPLQKTRIDATNDLLTLMWGIAPQQTATSNGAYLLRLTVGKTQAAVHIQVNPATPRPDAETESRRRFTFAIYHLNAGNPAGSFALMQEELKAHPDDVSAMSVAASALEKLNRKTEALSMLGAALESVDRQPTSEGGSKEPPVSLRRRYHALLVELVQNPKSVR